MSTIPDFDISAQPFITIALMGKVANGKSTVAEYITKVNPMRFRQEAEENRTIKLGYVNAKFYKCDRCPKPFCYQVNAEICEYCSDPTKLVLHVSFVDSPGHSDLQTTALSGASIMDYCLLLLAANLDNDIESNQHYQAIKTIGLNDRTIGVQNKIDLVSKAKAYEHYQQIKRKYDLRYIIPICAQFGFGVNYLIQFLVERIPHPVNEQFIEKINKPLKASIIRSFDVNKKGIDAENVNGAVVGGTIKQGKISIGDRVKIIPGIIMNNGKNIPLEAYITSLKTGENDLQTAYPGGLIGIGLSIDPSLSKEDRLVGNYLVSPDDESNRIFNTITVSYREYDGELKLKVNEIAVCMLGSIKRSIKILNINTQTKKIKLVSSVNMAGDIDDSLIILSKANNSIQLYGKITDIHN